MADFDGKQFIRDNMVEYLTIIKAELASVGSITGHYAGSAATFAALPTTTVDGTDVANGDWAILTDDDVANESGIYLTDGTAWTFSVDLTNFSEVVAELVATDAEAVAGTATDKVPTVKQVKDNYSLLAGDAAQTHLVKAGAIDTDEAVNANQFSSTAITSVEAQADWDAV